MTSTIGLGISGLLAFDRKLSSISHNIANATTEGYSRQDAVLSSRNPQFIGGSYLGTGVQVGATTRSVDQFLTNLLRSNTSAAGDLESFYQFAQQIDNSLADPTTGVADAFRNFFNSLQSVVNEPSSIPARQVFLSQTKILQDRLNGLDTSLRNEIENINQQTRQFTSEITGIANSIAELNVDIVAAVGGNAEPNDLLDRRDLLLDQLSELISIDTVVQDDGAVNVFVGNGLGLVIGGLSNTLTTTVNPQDASEINVVLKPNANISQVVTQNITGGKLGGALRAKEEIIEPALNSIGRIAISLALTFNQQHQLGADLNGNLGGNLFSNPNSTSATLSRAIGSSNNTGTGIIAVNIDDITRPHQGPTTLFSTAPALGNTGSLSTLISSSQLSINGVSIRATQAGDDTVSPATDALASAIAIANAINSSTTSHGVTATAEANNLYLGQFAPGAFAAGEFQINGVNVVTTGADETTLLQDINSLSAQTGVIATGDGNLNITLTAIDGRNIQINSNTTATTADFTNFNTANTTAFSSVQRAQVSLFSDADSIAIAGVGPGDVGFTAGNFPVETGGALTIDDYLLSYDGNFYTLIRQSDNQVIAQNTNVNNISVNGFSLSLNSGTVQAGDIFEIQPTRRGANSFSLLVNDPARLALGFPVKSNSNVNNAGSGTITVTEITNTSGTPTPTTTNYGNAFATNKQLSPPILIEFINSTTYQVFNYSNNIKGAAIGAAQTYNPQTDNEIFPIGGVIDSATGQQYTYDPGYRVSINGDVQAQDTFTVTYNNDAAADNRNALEFARMQSEKLVIRDSSSFQDGYGLLVADVGSTTRQTDTNFSAATSLLQQSRARREAVSGVNLDEEAANLIRFEQAYQAAAQVVRVGGQLFDILLDSFR